MKRANTLLRKALACLMCALGLTAALAFAPATQAPVLGTTAAGAASANARAKAAYKKELKRVIKNDKYGNGAYY